MIAAASRAPLAALALLAAAAVPAAAQEVRGVGFPQIAGETWMGLYTVAQPRGGDPRARGSSTFLFGEVAAGLHLSPSFSVQGLLHVEPVGEANPSGTNTFLRHQAAYIESLFADWRPHERVRFFGGKFSAPFGYGHHFFPGVLPRVRAHEVYLIRESVGAGATLTYLSDARWGEHDVSAAAFFLDTSFLSNTAFTRNRCCREGFERYSRNTLRQGGAGNNGRLDNFALALDGDRIGFLPNFTYHAALLSRAPGKGGTAREWGWAVGARYEARWTRDLATLFFAEHVEFRRAGGAPLGTEPSTFDEASGEEVAGAEVPVRERRRFTTVGARTSHGPWRVTAAWQRDQRKRSLDTVPTQSWLEVTAGRDLPWGFGVDVGWQRAATATGEDRRLARADGIVARLGYRASF